MTTPHDPTAAPGEQPALLEAVRALLVPLAQLAVARGLPYAAVEEMLRGAFVAAAHAAHPTLPEHRRVSRISAATGINRREVTRLTAAQQRSAVRTRSYPSELFAHWSTDPAYRDASGRPRRLPRFGAAPSFETLAQAVTRDMHPRALLEEMLRLGYATHDLDDDSVALAMETLVPRGDRDRMDAFLGANVGDHLSAAVANVLGDGRQHFEQALFADGLSEQSLQSLRGMVAEQWRAVTGELVPRIEKLIEDDARAGVAQEHRLRIGLFSFQAPVAAAGTPAPPPQKTAPRRRRRDGDKT
ncbi:MAG: hypothetical protein KF788_21340 [Piscinibacter sp.]|nr:hypothetical protein [Piscinibacter sp.]